MRRVAMILLGLASCRAAAAPLPQELERLLERARQAERDGNGARATGLYLRATIEHSEFAAPWAHYGEALRFWKHEPPAARDAFTRALAAPQADPRSLAFAWRGLGEIARSRGDVEGAVACLEKSLAVFPLVDAHRSLSALYATHRGDFARAADHARAAVALDPEDPIALLQWAVQAHRAGRAEEASGAFRKAIGLAGCDEAGTAGHIVHCCVLYNGACYHAVRGDRRLALAMLSAFFASPNHRHITREEVLGDPDFAGLASDPEFRALLDRHLPN